MQCGSEREWWAIDGETEADVSSFSQKEEASCFAFRKSASSRNSIPVIFRLQSLLAILITGVSSGCPLNYTAQRLDELPWNLMAILLQLFTYKYTGWRRAFSRLVTAQAHMCHPPY